MPWHTPRATVRAAAGTDRVERHPAGGRVSEGGVHEGRSEADGGDTKDPGGEAPGHLGEFIPHALWRIDARMRFSRRAYRGKRPLGEYFLDHFHITTSGFFHDPALKNTIEVMGTDKVYFSADYPFEKMEDAADWYDDSAVITAEESLKIGRTNAIKLFNLDLD